MEEISIGKLISEGWGIYKRNIKLFLTVALVIYLPMYILLLPFQSGLMRIWSIPITLLGLIGELAVIYIAKAQMDNSPIKLKEALSKAASRWWKAVYTNILQGILLIFLYLLFIVPGIIYSVYWNFTLYAVALKDKAGKNAMDFRKEIVKGRWWKVLGYAVVLGLVTLGAIISVSILMVILTSSLPKNIGNVLDSTVLSVVTSLFTVVWTVFFVKLSDGRPVEKITAQTAAAPQ